MNQQSGSPSLAPYGDAADRYRRDRHFTAIVDYMVAFLRQYSLTPVELREAAMLAASIHESQTIRPLFIPLRSLEARVPMRPRNPSLGDCLTPDICKGQCIGHGDF